MHYFGKSLAKGKAGEESFHLKHPTLIRTDGRKGDFAHVALGLIELKTDYYANPRNFFMEMEVAYEGEETARPGGPFQSQSHGVDWFVYQFAFTKVEYWFKTNELCEWLTLNKHLYKQSTVMNKKWAGFGLLIPIAVLSLESHACPINRQYDEGPKAL
jgi:hypothetical protein